MPISVERVAFGGWPKCQRLSNGRIEVISTTDVGPRIVRFGFVGGANEFAEFPAMQGLTGGDEWRMYGGHRFWHAPEDPALSYVPDNDPVAYEALPDGLRLTAPVEAPTGLQKEIELHMAAEAAHVRVVHRLTNRGAAAIARAPWALSVMAAGGTAILPLPPRGPHAENLLPTSHLVLWAYTNMADPRWTWGEKYVLLRQDPQRAAYQKVGAWVPDGWVAYACGGHLFVKRFTHFPEATYPDRGCSAETFTNAEMLELETVAPLAPIAPGASAEHVEDWHLFEGVARPEDDAGVEASVMPRVAGSGF
jgi:hypothetical protein